jgi:GntR family transcriptional regulator/MocR family aminotransferase
MMLDLFVDPAHSRRTSASLFEQIRDAIASGRLQPGDRLPTSRDLARELGVARSTITTVYGRLTGEGFLQTRTGDGTFVALLTHTARRRHVATTALTPRRRAPTPAAAVPVADLAIDLRSGRPDPQLFPLVDWRRCVITALQSPPPGYGDPAGLPALRRVLAAWITRSRGVVTTAEQVVIISGAQQAFDLFARLLLAPGDTVAIEEPGYPLARRAFQHHGMRVAPVPVDRDGIVVDHLPASARAVYVTPSHQSPTGVTMSAARRRALLEFAVDRDAAIIEDDYDTEYRHVDRPLEPIQRLDTTGRVLYVATFSKTLSPSLRLGFTVVPEPLVDPLCDTRALTDTQPPHLTQAALATFIAEGHLDRHLRRTRRIYRARHDIVATHITQLHVEGLIAPPHQANAGLHRMISLHDGQDATAVAARLAARGIAVDTSADWWSTNPQPGLVIGFGLADTGQLTTAFDHIRDAIRHARPSRSSR